MAKLAFFNLLTLFMFAFMLGKINALIVKGQVRLNNAPLELEDGLTLTVKVVDLSRMDGPTTVLASTVIENPKAFPIPFEFEVDQQAFDQTLQHTVSARIEKDGKLEYLTDVSTQVNTNGQTLLDVKKIVPVKEI